MLYSPIIDSLKNSNCRILKNELMSKYTTFRIGGPADLFIEVYDPECLALCLSIFRQYGVRFFILGNGSNLLINDVGYEGCILSLKGKFNEIKLENDLIVCGSGTRLSDACKYALENSLSGLEFAYGIPGTCGGAVCMNAGAYGGEMKDIVEYVDCFDKKRNRHRFSNRECNFSYRSSIFSKSEFIITNIAMKLKLGLLENIKSKMENLMLKRKSKQPLEYPSAGSFFKRPDGYHAASLIDQCGLKGFKIGEAAVSSKHSGFIINLGNATFKDIITLKSEIQSRVKKQTGVELLPEVIIL